MAVERYFDKGFDTGKLTISSDGGGCLPNFNAEGELLSMGFASCSALAACFKAMLDSNLAIEKVLPLMTSNVAALLRLHHKGKIASGYDADLVVLDEAHGIDSVMANGVWHKKQGQQLIKGLFEQ